MGKLSRTSRGSSIASVCNLEEQTRYPIDDTRPSQDFVLKIMRATVFGTLLICCFFRPTNASSGPANACSNLKRTSIPATSIALPTTGAIVRSTKLVSNSHSGEYCKVVGRIHSVDPSADDIRFEVNLPSKWNNKAVHFGGAAFDGYLKESDGRGSLVVSIPGEPTPLARGYATFGSDSGHQHHYLLLPDFLNLFRASFATNIEQRANFAGDALKKTHDVAMALIKTRYGSPPARVYFVGGSTGGREAFRVVQRWPQDYDGVIGAYAAWDQIQLDLQFIRLSKALYSQGGWLSRGKTKLLKNAVLNTCDALDGVKDGLISNPEACQFDAASLRCPAGRSGRKCLSDAELNTVATFASPQRTAFALTNGVTSIPGFNVLKGTDLTGSLGLCRRPWHPPHILLNAFYYVVGDGVLKYFLTNDPKFNSLTFDTTNGGAYRKGLYTQSKLMDSSDANISEFQERGGKFIMVHGTADATVPTNSSIDYYNRLLARFPQKDLNQFVRFYLIPGYGHGKGVFQAGFDSLTVLDDWVEKGIVPKDLVVADSNKATKGRTRPLCGYPTWPKYKGSGDINSAASFTCQTR